MVDQSQCVLCFELVIEVFCIWVLIDGSVFEHMVYGGEDGGGDGADGFLGTASGAQAQVLSLQVAILGP